MQPRGPFHLAPGDSVRRSDGVSGRVEEAGVAEVRVQPGTFHYRRQERSRDKFHFRPSGQTITTEQFSGEFVRI